MSMVSPVSTTGLGQSATGGEARAFEALVESTSDELLRLAARITGDAAEAEDVLQDAWSQALTALRAGQFAGASRVETWLTRIVLNAAFNARRKRQRREVRDARWEPGGPDAQRQVEVSVALRELAALLDRLPEEQAAALVLKELHGMTAGEVAVVLECSEGAVEQRLVRARATLREELGDE